MPELPEVETIRRALATRLIGATFSGVQIREHRFRRVVDPLCLRRLVGQSLTGIKRRAKYLLLKTKRDVLVIHLGMSGRLLLTSPQQPIDQHDHICFTLRTTGTVRELRFHDPRRFGMVIVLERTRLEQDPAFARLGPDPFDDAFSPEYLYRFSRGSSRPIKNLLMDASVVGGIGNIYANELLWRARVHPLTRSGRVRMERWVRIHASCLQVLRDAIAAGGTTLNDYADPNGNLGYFSVSLSVYGRSDKECPRCSRRLRRIVQSGRSTFYCPGCQH